jgi:hypothetical protein
MHTLGEDLLLLAIRPNGKLGVPQKLRFGLSGSELVRLAAARRIDIVRGRIVILDAAPAGDPLLDAALRDMARGRRPPTAKAWVARNRPGLVGQYLDRLAAAGVLRAEPRKVLGVFPATRWTVGDAARLAEVRDRLDAIAARSGPVDSERAAFAGLAGAIGLTLLIYPGLSGAAARRNLEKAARQDRPAHAAVDGASPAATQAAIDATRAATQAAIDTATQAATQAAIDAATRAATQAAIDAATQAAIDAATTAATDAANHAASHHGGAVGGHH